MTNPELLLSVVVVSRNDDHGINLMHRMQLFVTGWLEQAKRHNLNSELVIVEWNPLPNRPRLAQALKWPKDTVPCAIRIIEVSPEIHQRYRYADKLPVFQMIGKNVGIRRARGRFILATNVDILFSDEIIDFLASGKLTSGHMYRVDRYDVPTDIPALSFDDQLNYCKEHIIRINSRGKTQILGKVEESVFQAFQKRVQALSNARNAAILGKDILLYFYSYLYNLIYKNVVRPILYGPALHTNACGDFTLMAREHWLAMRGYPEFEMHSMHLDNLLCMEAHNSGAKELVLKDPMRIYHIEHAPGSGFTPGPGGELMNLRLKNAGIQQLTPKELWEFFRQMRWKQRTNIFNKDEGWGLAKESLPETIIATE